ncbi:MAG: metalloregulator ArsR/SmtB family transcription factor [Hyphomicrobiales bacterium]|nr:metalloregulator ArsR/SmtB family transcription factor [Hyphomicrobiales bacterium]
MDEKLAIKALASLAQEHRLRIFRLLVCEGTNGMHASAIADAVRISRTSVSFHLKELEQGGLLWSWREGRNIRYAIAVNAVREFLVFLTEDCCQGRPEICRPAAINMEEFCCGYREDENV